MTFDKRNTIIQVNRMARTAIGTVDLILTKDALDRHDLELLVERMLVYENRIDIRIRRDIEYLLTAGALPEQQ